MQRGSYTSARKILMLQSSYAPLRQVHMLQRRKGATQPLANAPAKLIIDTYSSQYIQFHVRVWRTV